MRDAELRFATLRMRILETAISARGEDVTQVDVLLRHPGHARVTTSRPGEVGGGQHEIWICDGDIVRTYAAAHKLGTQRPIRNRPRGLDDPDFPGMARVYEPVTALPMETLPETFVHPAGFCQNVLATGRCTIVGQERGRRSSRDPCALRAPPHGRDRRRPARLPGRHRGRPRDRHDPPPDRARPATRPRAMPRSSMSRRMHRSPRRPSTSSSRPGRRCSTEDGRRVSLTGRPSSPGSRRV